MVAGKYGERKPLYLRIQEHTAALYSCEGSWESGELPILAYIPVWKKDGTLNGTLLARLARRYGKTDDGHSAVRLLIHNVGIPRPTRRVETYWKAR
jgi:hypothetical protein